MTTMTIERVLAFNGLDVLVAQRRGPLRGGRTRSAVWPSLPPGEIRSTAEGT